MTKVRWKFFGILIMMSFVLSLCMKTEYSVALGDTLFESIGLKSWSAGSDGFHLSLIYCLVIMMIIYWIFSRTNEAPRDVGIFKRVAFVFLMAIMFVHLFNGITWLSIRTKDGLESVEILKEGNSMHMKNGPGYFEFNAELSIRNHGGEQVEFIMNIEHPIDDYDSYISVDDFNGSPVLFTVPARTTMTIYIDSEDYLIEGEFDGGMGSNSNGIFPVVLTNLEGESYYYDRDFRLGQGVSVLP